MLSRVQPLQKSQIYMIKKSKQPDHLYNLLEKNKNRQQTSVPEEDLGQKDKIKKQIMQKRIDMILKNDARKPKVSEPVPFAVKKWISPLAQIHQNKQKEPFGQNKKAEIKLVRQSREQVQRVVRILDINKSLRYFGQYLQVSYQPQKKIQVAKLTQKQSKITYVTQKFSEIIKKQKPKLCIMNFTTQKKVIFINYLQEDKFYQNVIRKNDDQLTRILIQALQVNGNFTMASYLRFYELFVWQSADKSQQIQFVLNLLMNECNERSIVEISKKVDIICCKIFIQNFSKSLDNFNQIMKKLLFGDDYQYSTHKEYHMTRKALTESLQRNEQCISIFINIFYAS